MIAEIVAAGGVLQLRELVKITGYDERKGRQMIAAERRAGIPILSDNRRGYYLPTSDDETRRFCRSMRHRAIEILRTARAVEMGKEKLEDVR